jgi:hypothetical protein
MSCGCVSGQAKRALVMLAEATGRREARGESVWLPESGRVSLALLRELKGKGYVDHSFERPRRWRVMPKGYRKILEWQRLGMV